MNPSHPSSMSLVKKKNEKEIKKKQEKVNVFSRLNEEIEEICPRCIDLPLHCDVSKTCNLVETNSQKARQRERFCYYLGSMKLS